MKTITFHDYKKIRIDFLENRFAAMRWFQTEFKNNARQCYRYTLLLLHVIVIIIDETLRNFYALPLCFSGNSLLYP